MNELDLQNSILRAMPRLALGMLHKLSIHAKKGPWDGTPFEKKLAKLDEEYFEFRDALVRGEPYHRVLDEGADLANMVMIITDHVATHAGGMHFENCPGHCWQSHV